MTAHCVRLRSRKRERESPMANNEILLAAIDDQLADLTPEEKVAVAQHLLNEVPYASENDAITDMLNDAYDSGDYENFGEFASEVKKSLGILHAIY